MEFRSYNYNSEKRVKDNCFHRAFYLDKEGKSTFARVEVVSGRDNDFGASLSLSKEYVEESTIYFCLKLPWILAMYFNFSLPWLEKMEWYSKFLKEDKTQVPSYGLNGGTMMKSHAKTRKFEFSVYKEFIWIKLGSLDDGSSSKWQDISIDWKDLLFGKMNRQTTELSSEVVDIPMNEKTYRAEVKIFHCTWKRSRLPWLSYNLHRGEIFCEEGIPHPGKGTESYNCGEETTSSLSCPVDYENHERAVSDMIGKFVSKIEYYRRSYPL